MPRLLLLPLLGSLLATPAHAGGHFDIDDAGTLDQGQCQYEAWGGRFGSARATDYHLGPACRVGPVELGFNIDRTSVPGEHAYGVGPQLKWTFTEQPDQTTLSAALFVSGVWDATHGGRAGGQFAVPVSWRALDSLWINANLGYDWSPGNGERTGRGGLQAAWAVDERLWLIAERFRSFEIWSTRAGVRISLTPTISVDLSASRSGPDGVRGYSIGLNQVFQR